MLTDNPLHPLQEVALMKLREVIDPELGINIVDLGFIYDVKIDSESKVMEITMTLSTPGCPMGSIISSMAENAVLTGFPDYAITIHIVWDPCWSTELISENGRILLGIK
jgi:metal-sulfur cluster biosynthetic enzyme